MQGVVGHSGNGNPSATFQSTAGMAPIRPSLSAAGNNNSMARSASIGGSGGGFLVHPEVSGGHQIGSGRRSALGV
ncbi:hypothetical protein FRB94_007428 [Tulasnella sp. JGI-2019a]|nr:hypothetical protein FRB94_007428 [Tulasnella sp. JGI-2019a]